MYATLLASCRGLRHDLWPLPRDLALHPGRPDSNFMIDSYDWSLEPSAWASLVLPSFDDEKLWGDDSASFRAHTQSSPFWSNYEKL